MDIITILVNISYLSADIFDKDVYFIPDKLQGGSYMSIAIISSVCMDAGIVDRKNPSCIKDDEKIKQNEKQSANEESGINRVIKAEIPREILMFKAEQAREQSKAAGKSASVMAKCMRISIRIVQGDNVPPQDDKYLAEHNPELHMRSWMMRIPKADPEDHDSILDEENNGDLAKMLHSLISGNPSSPSFGSQVNGEITMPEIAL